DTIVGQQLLDRACGHLVQCRGHSGAQLLRRCEPEVVASRLSSQSSQLGGTGPSDRRSGRSPSAHAAARRPATNAPWPGPLRSGTPAPPASVTVSEPGSANRPRSAASAPIGMKAYEPYAQGSWAQSVVRTSSGSGTGPYMRPSVSS